MPTTGRILALVKNLIENKIDDSIPQVFNGATVSSAGTSGLVPAPASSEHNYILTGGGSWISPTALNEFVTISGGQEIQGTKTFKDTTVFSSSISVKSGASISGGADIKGGLTVNAASISGVLIVSGGISGTATSALSAGDAATLNGIPAGSYALAPFEQCDRCCCKCREQRRLCYELIRCQRDRE